MGWKKNWDTYKRNETIKIFINSGQLNPKNCLTFIRIFARARDDMHPCPGEGWEGESPVRRGAAWCGVATAVTTEQHQTRDHRHHTRAANGASRSFTVPGEGLC